MQAIYSNDHIEMGVDIKNIICSGENMYVITSGRGIYKTTPQSVNIGATGGRCHPWYPSVLRRLLIDIFCWIMAKLAGG